MIIGIIIIFLMLLGFAWGHYQFNKEWNHGKCKDCGKPWKLFDYDSQGGKGYTDGKHYLWD